MIISLLLELNNQFSINEIISSFIVYGVIFYILYKFFPQYIKYIFYVWAIDLLVGYNIYRTNKIHNNYKKDFLSFNNEIINKINENSKNKEESNIKEETNIKMVVKKEFPSRENTKDNPQEFVTQEENKLIEN
jgi:hypothetical protein